MSIQSSSELSSSARPSRLLLLLVHILATVGVVHGTRGGFTSAHQLLPSRTARGGISPRGGLRDAASGDGQAPEARLAEPSGAMSSVGAGRTCAGHA
jgi:hypothetical protein